LTARVLDKGYFRNASFALIEVCIILLLILFIVSLCLGEGLLQYTVDKLAIWKEP